MRSRSTENKGVSIILCIVAAALLFCALAANFNPDPVVQFTGRVVAVAIIIVIALTYSGSRT